MHSKTALIAFMLILTQFGACQEDADNSTYIEVPAVAPSDAHGPINRAFTTWSLEFVQFNETVGVGGEPNVFSENLIRNLLSVTGARPFMRVGGTSGDDGASYTPNEPGYGLEYPPSFFESFKSIQDIDYVFQVPLTPNNVSNSVEFFRAGYENIGEDRLYAVEIGNEDDVYIISGMSFNYKGYVDRFLEFENAIIETGLLKNESRFQAIDSQNDHGAQEDIP